MALLVPTVRDLDRPPALSPTGRPGSRGAVDYGPVALPPECTLVGWLDVEGTGEAQRLALVTHKGNSRILKLYHPDTGPSDAVRAAWPRAKHLMRLRHHDHVDGRAFEIMDDAGDPLGGEPGARRTTLRDVLGAHSGGLAEDVVVDMVGQLSTALAALQRARIVHLDVRPENVLVTLRPSGDRLDVTLVDLGSAVRLARPVMWVPEAPTSAYAAREVLLSGSATAATDWWSLGILAAELAAGVHPFLCEDVRTVRRQLLDGDVPRPAGLPARIAGLVAGLTAPGDNRWGADQVTAWAGGRAPAIPNPAPPPVRPTFVFAGEEYRHLEPLVLRMQEASDHAAAILFGPGADRWDELKGWLRDFDRPGFDAAQVAAELERRGAGPDPWSPAARLLVLIHRAMPGLPMSYRGVPLDRALLREDDPRLEAVVADLWRWRLLAEVDGAVGADAFADIDDRWRQLDVRWRAVATVLDGDDRRLHRILADLPPEEWRTDLLRVAADPRSGAELRANLQQLRTGLGARSGRTLSDLDELAATVLPRKRRRTPDVDELVGLVMLDRVADVARELAELAREDEERTVAAALTHAAAWRQNEFWRLADRPVAMGWAAAYLGIVFVVLAGLLITADTALPPRILPPATADAFSAAWAFLVVGMLVMTACEVSLAATIGGRYHYNHSLFTLLLRAVHPVARFGGHRYLRAALVLVGAAVAAGVVLLALLVAPWAVMAALAIAHLLSARRRYRDWLKVRKAERAPPENFPEGHRYE